MNEQYIPDLTERFPEGFDGIDLTDPFFPCEIRGYYDTLFDYEFDKAVEEIEKHHQDTENMVAKMTNEELIKEYYQLVDTSIYYSNDPDKEEEETWNDLIMREIEKRRL